MNIVTTIKEWQQIRRSLNTTEIGFVATMGNLHLGHLSLCEQSIKQNAVTVVSIFVNPTQFNETADFKHYPRTLAADQIALSQLNIDYLLLFDADEMYPDAFEIQVTETKISQQLEGEFRPGHFNGMLTVVLKFLNLVRASRAYFGEKDYQQLLLIKKMASALFLTTEIIGAPIVRAADGLALSSRNARLTEQQRRQAAHFPRLLSSDLTIENIITELQRLDFQVDYIAEKWQRRLGAVRLGDIRLIDNFLSQ